jgi:hypothetical protein
MLNVKNKKATGKPVAFISLMLVLFKQVSERVLPAAT